MTGGRPELTDVEELEVSFVIPCLDEAETIEGCILAAQECIEKHCLSAEIVVADNGSTDGSQEIARRVGARLVPVAERGYGASLMGGIEEAFGRFVVMGDGDLSYDFAQAMPFIEKLRDGCDLVMGSRLKGSIDPGSMPWLHHWVGNPILSWLGRSLFHSSVSDFHCGLRALSKSAYEAMGLRTTGMEFASELVVKASLLGMRIEEVPIAFHRDGRSRPPHLRTWRDGWRHLRFLLTLSPRWTLGFPGLLLLLIGAVLMGSVWTGPARVRYHSMVAASFFVVVGYQALTTAIALRIYTLVEELGPPAPQLIRAFRYLRLEVGLAAGAVATLAGLSLVASVIWRWFDAGLGALDPSQSLPPMILGCTLAALGIQTVLMSFVYSMMGIQRRRNRAPQRRVDQRAGSASGSG